MAGIFPCPTFKDKSTYIESSTKVYDDVSDPTMTLGWSPSTHTHERGWAVGPACRCHCQAYVTPVFPACHIYFLAKSRVPRATWKFPWPSLLDQVWVDEDKE